MKLLFWLAIAYIAGSIPVSYLIARLVKGIDIREHGSGNPGATNVYRVVGPVPGVIAFILDALKGYLPVFFALRAFDGNPVAVIAVGLAAVAGHMFTLFLRFKGGKGVATAAGVFFALLPLPTLYAFGVFCVILFATGYVSLGSIVAAVFLPGYCWLTGFPAVLSAFATLVAIFIIIKHRTNIRKLLSGTEHRFSRHHADPGQGR